MDIFGVEFGEACTLWRGSVLSGLVLFLGTCPIAHIVQQGGKRMAGGAVTASQADNEATALRSHSHQCAPRVAGRHIRLRGRQRGSLKSGLHKFPLCYEFGGRGSAALVRDSKSVTPGGSEAGSTGSCW